MWASKDMEMKNSSLNHAKLWEMALFCFNFVAAWIYDMLILYITYYATGFLGIGVVLIGNIVMVMRLWDGLIDPVIGIWVDKVKGRFGKFRPILLTGNLVMAGATFIMYFFVNKLRGNYFLCLAVFILVYAIYVVGYTFQTVVSNAAQTCLTSEPRQRSSIGLYTCIYGSITVAVFYWVVANVWTPKYTYTDASGEVVSGFYNLSMHHEMWKWIALVSFLASILAIIGLWRKDRPEYWGRGDAETADTQPEGKRRVSEYWDILRGNRPLVIAMLINTAKTICQKIQGSPVASIIVFGIAMRFGQKKTIQICSMGAMIFLALNTVIFFILDPTTFSFAEISVFTIIFVLSWLIAKSLGDAAGYSLPPMIADVIDYETYRTGRYSPGKISTIYSFVEQTVSSLSTTIVSLLLMMIGFTTVQPTPETPYTAELMAVGLIFTFGFPFLGWLIAFIAIKFYDLDKQKMEIIRLYNEKFHLSDMSDRTERKDT